MLLRRGVLIQALHWLGVAFTLVAAAVCCSSAVLGGGDLGDGRSGVLWIALQAGSRWLRAGAWILLR
jgi:hypothetical protein